MDVKYFRDGKLVRNIVLIVSVITIMFLYQVTSYASEAGKSSVLGVENAMKLPISDAHFHVMGRFMQPNSLLEMMDKHNVRWAGGAGSMAPDARMTHFHSIMGERLRLFGGQRESIQCYVKHGQAPFDDPTHPCAIEILTQIEAGLKDGRFSGIGELHVNSRYSAPNIPGMRRKLSLDSPTFKAIFELAQKYNVAVDFHIEWESDTVKQLERMLLLYPNVPFKLAHCGKTTSAKDIRRVMGKYPNLYCDLSARPGQHGFRDPKMNIFNANGFQQRGWRELIEDYSDRFTVGIDDVDSWDKYTEVVNAIRKGLLANLSPEAAEKVAYQNADRLYGGQ
jgi:hypothetical protein